MKLAKMMTLNFFKKKGNRLSKVEKSISNKLQVTYLRSDTYYQMLYFDNIGFMIIMNRYSKLFVEYNIGKILNGYNDLTWDD